MKVRFFSQKLLSLMIVCLCILSCKAEKSVETGMVPPADLTSDDVRILYVDSYHWEYQWSRRIREGLYSALGFSYDEQGLPVGNPDFLTLKVIQMDTKRNISEDFKVDAGQKARDEIERWKPDLVICSDDNAAKYLIKPYYIDSEIPFIFCGINHDASEYGFPPSHITGMVEIHNAGELLNILKGYALGSRIAFLSGDNFTGRKIGQSVQEQLGGEVDQVYVNSYREWKEQYEALQKKADVLLFETAEYFPDWDGNLRALEWFVSRVTRIPTGAWDDSLKTVALVTLERMGEEQGEWAGETALRVISGEVKIGEIPMVRSKRAAVYLNMKLAKEQGVLFPADLLDIAHLTNLPNSFRKVLYVNSYHRGYAWSDDSFARYVIQPYYRGGTMPFVFCGVNWDAGEYSFPSSHITGMVEVDPLKETVDLLSRYSDGNRVGLLGVDSFYVQRMVIKSEELLGKPLDAVQIVTRVEEWEKAYLELQEDVDMLILTSPVGLEGFSENRVVDFVNENSRIPSGITVDKEIEYALLGVSKVAEEQGWWAGNRALDILSGVSVKEISQTVNQQTKTMLNMPLARALGIHFSPELLDRASLYSGEDE